MIYIGGEISNLVELPSQGEIAIEVAQKLFAANKVVTAFDVEPDNMDNWEDPYWGISGDLNYKLNDDMQNTGSVLDVRLFKSEDGKYYTALCSASNMGHQIFVRNAWAVWDFMKQFSRAEDGSIQIDSVTYTLPSDDSSVADNSYNTAE